MFFSVCFLFFFLKKKYCYLTRIIDQNTREISFLSIFVCNHVVSYFFCVPFVDSRGDCCRKKLVIVIGVRQGGSIGRASDSDPKRDEGSKPLRSTRTTCEFSPSQECCAESLFACPPTPPPPPHVVHVRVRWLMETRNDPACTEK